MFDLLKLFSQAETHRRKREKSVIVLVNSQVFKVGQPNTCNMILAFINKIHADNQTKMKPKIYDL